MATRTLGINAGANIIAKPKSVIYTLAELMNDAVALGNELRTDHATTKVTVDQLAALAAELGTDAATQKTLNDELIADHATFKTVVDDIKTLVNDIRSKLAAFVADGMLSSAALAIGSTVQNVSNAAFLFTVGGVVYSKAADAVGVAPGNDVIPTGKFGAVAIDIGVNGTLDVVEATDNATGYNTAPLAIAGLPAVAGSHVRTGTVTATKSDGDFTFGTTSLAAANSTVAYTSAAGVLAALGAAVGTSAPATLTATAPATLSASTTITAGPATLSAAAVDDISFREIGAP